MANIAAYVYPIWNGTANQRITNTYEERVAPFNNFKWTTKPRLPGAALTPLKLGVVLLQILDGVLKEQSWPGQVSATIWDFTTQRRLYAGSLGLSNTSPTNSDSSLSANNTVQMTSPTFEKRWLRCWLRVFRVIMAQNHFDHYVSDSIDISPDPGKATEWKGPCGADLPYSNDKITIEFFPRARKGNREALKFTRMADAMVKWATRVASGDFPWSMLLGIYNDRKNNKPVTILGVEVDGRSASTATA